jgi:hypothetical protein
MTSRAILPAVRHKLMRPRIKVLDASTGLIEAVVSDELPDRDDDVLRVGGWDFKAFEAHPVLMANHDYGSILSQIGKWHGVEPVGQKIIGQAQYYIGQGNDQADWGFKLAEMGMAAYSVAFRPDMAKATERNGDSVWPSYEFNGQELLEISHVTVPANPRALQAVKSLGSHPVVTEIVDEMLGDAPADFDAQATAAALWPYIQASLEDFDQRELVRMFEQTRDVDPEPDITPFQEVVARW